MAKMTWKLLDEQYRKGVGSGWLESYVPFQLLRRRNPSPVGNQVAGALLPDMRRACCFLARIEWLLSLLSFWLGAIDVREQFPLWPFEHPHPLSGLPGCSARDLPNSRGAWEIARDAGIEHGNYVGSDVPFPLTTDLLVTFASTEGLACAALPIKAESVYRTAEPISRLRERLELERRFHGEIGVHVPGVVTERLITETLAGQLVMYSAAARPAPHLASPNLIMDFAAHVTERATRQSILQGVAHACGRMKLASRDGDFLFNHCVWRRFIDVDITVPIVRSYPVVLGGTRIANALRETLFGEQQ